MQLFFTCESGHGGIKARRDHRPVFWAIFIYHFSTPPQQPPTPESLCFNTAGMMPCRCVRTAPQTTPHHNLVPHYNKGLINLLDTLAAWNVSSGKRDLLFKRTCFSVIHNIIKTLFVMLSCLLHFDYWIEENWRKQLHFVFYITQYC